MVSAPPADRADVPGAEQLRSLAQSAAKDAISYRVTRSKNEISTGEYNGVVAVGDVTHWGERFRIKEIHPPLAGLRRETFVMWLVANETSVATMLEGVANIAEYVAADRAELLAWKEPAWELKRARPHLITYHMYGDGERLLADQMAMHADQLQVAESADEKSVIISYVDEEAVTHEWTLDADRRYVVTQYRQVHDGRTVLDRRTTYATTDGLLHPSRSVQKEFFRDDGRPLREVRWDFDQLRRAPETQPKDFTIEGLELSDDHYVMQLTPNEPPVQLFLRDGVPVPPENAMPIEEPSAPSDAPVRHIRTTQTWSYTLGGVGLTLAVIALVLFVRRARA